MTDRLVVLISVLLASCAADHESSCRVPRSAELAPDEVTGPAMRPGSNCLRCHAKDGLAAKKPFSFGGTIFPSADSDVCEGVSGVTIHVTDAQGREISVISNEAGNFWSAAPLTPPFSIRASRAGREVRMPIEAPTGGCALCHSWPDATGGAVGRIRQP